MCVWGGGGGHIGSSTHTADRSIPRRYIPIGVSLYSPPTGTAYIEQLVESKKSTRTAKKGNTVLSKVSKM